jgi:disulfide bond formation protein DsbB
MMLSTGLFHRHPLALAALLAAAALGGAWVSQYGFGLKPCDLCLLQRYPYLALVALGLTGEAITRRRPRPRRPLLLLAAGLFLADAGIAAYHVGVEQGWIAGPSACSGATTATSIDALREQLNGAALVSCKDTTFAFLGLSMAGWNLLYALGGAAVMRYLLRQPMESA